MIQLVRQKSFSYSILKPLSQKRGFFFKLAAGFSKELDPLSGMTVNLVEVDHWLQQLICDLEAQKKPLFDFAESLFESQLQLQAHGEVILKYAVESLQTQANLVGAKLVQVQLQEERQWTLSWNKALPANKIIFESVHYLENVFAEQVDVLRIKTSWSKTARDHFHFPQESLNLLKGLSVSSLKLEEGEKFKNLLGKSLSPSACIVAIEVENLSQNWKCEFR